MAGGRVDGLRIARRGPIALAVIRRAEKRTALDHLAGDARPRSGGIVTLRLGDAAGVARRAAGLVGIMSMARGVPVLGPAHQRARRA